MRRTWRLFIPLGLLKISVDAGSNYVKIRIQCYTYTHISTHAHIYMCVYICHVYVYIGVCVSTDLMFTRFWVLQTFSVFRTWRMFRSWDLEEFWRIVKNLKNLQDLQNYPASDESSGPEEFWRFWRFDSGSKAQHEYVEDSGNMKNLHVLNIQNYSTLLRCFGTRNDMDVLQILKITEHLCWCGFA